VAAAIERVVTSGFMADGVTPLDNNVWLVGDDTEVVVIDAAHDAQAIATAAGVRRVLAIICTHAHQDHINAAGALAALVSAPVWLHASDVPLWRRVYRDRPPDEGLTEGDTFRVAGVSLSVLHTPGHTPGSVCVRAPELGVLFSGDTLFPGGPGATGGTGASFGAIIESIRDRLFTLPPETTVHTGHGESTTIGAEAPHLGEWAARGW
jgi:glyoxylase-like metal-dependent hydrolase (beta-lactamase superfamily II)